MYVAGGRMTLPTIPLPCPSNRCSYCTGPRCRWWPYPDRREDWRMWGANWDPMTGGKTR